jgi:alcohol dehydrogenase class IV
METHNSRITLQYKRRYNVWREKNVIVNEKQLSVKEILDETSGKLIEESIKVSKAELIKTNTTLETLKHNFDNFEHDSIDTILNREYKTI